MAKRTRSVKNGGTSLDLFLSLDGAGGLRDRIFRSLRSSVLDGRLAPGTRVPSSRAIASENGISRNTVLAAYDQLIAEGYFETLPGSGTYVASEIPDNTDLIPKTAVMPEALPKAEPVLSAFAERALKLRPVGQRAQQAAGVIDFWYGHPAVDDVPKDIWRKLLLRQLHRMDDAGIGYGAAQGLPALREAISGYLQRARGIDSDPDTIVVVNGSQQALDLVARVMVDPSDRVVVEEPCYPGAREVFAAAGSRIIPVPVDADGLDTSMLNAATNGAARLIYVTPSHQFPTGGSMSVSRRIALLDWAYSCGAIVVEDDYDGEFRYGVRPLETLYSMDRMGQVVYVGTLSKSLFPALRIGFVIAPRSLVPALVATKRLTDRHTPILEQFALADFILEGHFERHLRRVRKRNSQRRSALLSALAREFGKTIRTFGENAGLNLVVEFPGLASDRMSDLMAAAAAEGVHVYPVSSYYAAPPQAAGLLIGYAALSHDEINEGVRRLGRAMQALTD